MADLTSDDEARLRRSIASFRMPSFTESSDDSFRLPSLAPESVSSHEESKEELASMTSLHESQIINIDDKYAQPINLSMEDSSSRSSSSQFKWAPTQTMSTGGTSHYSVDSLEGRKRPEAYVQPASNPQKQSRDGKPKRKSVTWQEIDAKPYHKERRRKHQEKLRLLGAMVFGGCILIVGLTLSLFVVIRQMAPGSPPVTTAPSRAPTALPTAVPTLEQYTSIIDGLPRETLRTIRYQPQSAQAKAYEWVANDPQLVNQTDAINRQRFAFMTLYYSTSGESWAGQPHWIGYERMECERPFPLLAVCDEDGEFFVGLLLSKNQLKGPLPPEIGLLTTLRELSLSNNDIMGSLPSEIGLLSNL